jgi:lipopolysaccharide biosynthesis regulator YciM
VNNQWFCQKCELFYQPGQGGTAALDHIAEEISRAFSGRPATPVYPCQGCGVPLSFIQQYGRWYCYGCRKWY